VIRAGGYASALVAVSCALSSCSGKSDCPNGHCTADFTWPEGGEIRVEFVGTPSGSLSRGIAFFKSAQTPELTPFPAVAPTGGGVCNDLSATPTWPTAPATFTEMDVGDLSITGGGETFAFTKQTHFTDFLGRTHDVAYAFQDAARMVTPSTLSDVVMTGSSVTSPATWFGALGNARRLPARPRRAPRAPRHPPRTGPRRRVATAAADHRTTRLGLVAFLDGNGTLAQLCLSYESGNGFDVPKEVVAKIPPKGTLVRGHTTHQFREFPKGRRVDVIGTWCYATPYDVQ
jgi:hypothetical protein